MKTVVEFTHVPHELAAKGGWQTRVWTEEFRYRWLARMAVRSAGCHPLLGTVRAKILTPKSRFAAWGSIRARRPGRLSTWFAARRHKKRWPVEMQLEKLRVQVQQDLRWLAHDPVALALCERYESMLAEDWMRRDVKDISEFRREIGRDPHEMRRRVEALERKARQIPEPRC